MAETLNASRFRPRGAVRSLWYGAPLAEEKTHRVKFYVELIETVPVSRKFEEGDRIEVEGHDLEVHAVERAGGYSSHPDAISSELVVRLKPPGPFSDAFKKRQREKRQRDASA